MATPDPITDPASWPRLPKWECDPNVAFGGASVVPGDPQEPRPSVQGQPATSPEIDRMKPLPRLPDGPWRARLHAFWEVEKPVIGMMLFNLCVLLLFVWFAYFYIDSYFGNDKEKAMAADPVLTRIISSEKTKENSVNVRHQYIVHGKTYTTTEGIRFNDETKSRVQAEYAPGNRHWLWVSPEHPDKTWLAPHPDRDHLNFWVALMLIYGSISLGMLRRLYVVIWNPEAAGQHIRVQPGRRVSIRLSSSNGVVPALWGMAVGCLFLLAPCLEIARLANDYQYGLGYAPSVMRWMDDPPHTVATLFFLLVAYAALFPVFAGLWIYVFRIWRGSYDLEADLSSGMLHLPYSNPRLSFTEELLEEVRYKNLLKRPTWTGCHRTVALTDCAGIRTAGEKSGPESPQPNSLIKTQLQLCLKSGGTIVIMEYSASPGSSLNWEGLQMIADWLNRMLELPGISRVNPDSLLQKQVITPAAP
ncbi:MAG TPA: hypothetical protein VK970_20530 [Candidatus Methylacidiphilales bacterium]|nr:hypothetical protein [Candidatus Methylacidiphilales bacterium]